MGALSRPPRNAQPARPRGPVGFGAALVLACTLAASAAHAASANAHTGALAALADTRAAIAEIVAAEDHVVTGPAFYRRHAQRAVNALVGERDPAFDKTSGNPGDAAGAIGRVNAMLDRRDNPPWVDSLHGVQVNLMAAVARLRDALEARQLEDYQFDVTSALLSLQAVVGRPTQLGVFGGLTGALATTTLGVPEGALQVSACAPNTRAPAYGVEGGYLAFVAVPASAGTATLPEDFGSLDVRLEGNRLVVYTAARPLVAALCSKRSAGTPPAPQGKADPPADPPAGDPPAAELEAGPPPALYTSPQAKAGRSVYLKHCLKCHGRDLQGTLAPAVAGTSFLQTAQRNGWTLYIMRYLVVNTMPLHEPGTLSPEQYANVLAYLLASSCYPAGDKPFPQRDDEQFKHIALQPLTGARPDNRKFGTCAKR
jgi:polar amino acid transport system substrate-binding protein